MVQINEILNQNSNLLLILVTTIYVILTWFLLRENRIIRKTETKPYLLPVLMPMDASWRFARIRVYNLGGGAALNIEVKIRLQPRKDADDMVYFHALLLPTAYTDFYLSQPKIAQNDGEIELKALVDKHEQILVDLKWLEPFRGIQKNHIAIAIKHHMDSWHFQPMPTDEIPVQLDKLNAHMEHIDETLKRLTNVFDNKRFNLTLYRLNNRRKYFVERLRGRLRL